VHKNGKPLLNKDLPQAEKGAYKPAYKKNRKIAPNEVDSTILTIAFIY
jgi:hypothetical protein